MLFFAFKKLIFDYYVLKSWNILIFRNMKLLWHADDADFYRLTQILFI